MRFGLYPKFMLLMVSLAAIPVGFAGFQLIRLNERGIQAAVLELHTKVAETLAEEVAGHIRTTDDKVRFTLTAMAQNVDWHAKQALLQSFIETHAGTTELAILDKKGRELLKVYDPQARLAPRLRSHADDPTFQEFKKDRRRAARLEPGEPAPLLRLYYPLQKDFGFHVAFEMRDLSQRIQTERVGGTGMAVLVDREGRPVLHPVSLDPTLLKGFSSLDVVRQAVGALSVGASDFTDPLERAQVGAYAPLPTLGGAVVVLQARSEAYAAAYAMRFQAMLVLVIFVALALVVSWFTARQLSNPILDLTRRAEAVARGDFETEVRIETDDELRDLAETFNYMTRRLKRYAELQVDRLVSEQRKTEAILFSIADGILMTDHEGRLQLANRMAREVLGLPAAEALEGRFLHELVPDAAISQLFVEMMGAPEEGQPRELDLSTDTYRRIFQVTVQPVVAPGRAAPLGVVFAIHDVTLEKEIEKMKEDFIHSMTHDLRSPMASIRGFLEILLKGDPGVLTSQQRKMLESMDKASFRLLGMINNILDMAKMRAGRMEVNLMRCSLGEVAERVVETMEPLVRRKKILLEIVGDRDARLVADPDLMERVFTNLVSNALKFTPEAGRITVGFADRIDELEIWVVDTGPGLAADLRDRVFERFQQGKSGRAGGTGLGLAICKFIVEAHRGRIAVGSTPGQGARFTFVLPKHLVPEELGPYVAAPPLGPSTADRPAARPPRNGEAAASGGDGRVPQETPPPVPRDEPVR